MSDGASRAVALANVMQSIIAYARDSRMGYVDQWIYYEAVRRGPKFHLFVGGADVSVCGYVRRNSERAQRAPVIQDTSTNRCWSCKAYVQRNKT